MCPGGYVVAAASEDGRGRDQRHELFRPRTAKTPMLRCLSRCSRRISPATASSAGCQLAGGHRAAGLCLRRRELSCPGAAPGRFPCKTARHSRQARVTPTYRPGVTWGDLRQVLPPKITDALAQAIPLLDRRLHGFALPGRGPDRAGDPQLLPGAYHPRAEPAGQPCRGSIPAARARATPGASCPLRPTASAAPRR